MADQDYILAPATVAVEVRLDPVLCALDAMMLLYSESMLSGVSAWVKETRAAMPAELRRDNALVIEGMYRVLMPDRIWPGFLAYVDDLAVRDAVAMRDAAIEWMCGDVEKLAAKGLKPLERDTLLNDLNAFLDFHQAMHDKEREDYPELEIGEFDRQFFTEMHSLYRDPDEMRAFIVRHLRTMWDEYLAQDWAHTRPMLEEAVEAFHQLEYRGMTALEAVRAVTGRDLSAWEKDLAQTEKVVFIPSAHLGPYVRMFKPAGSVAEIVFGARLPEGARVTSPALSRSELLVRLSALADDTRLQILDLLTRHDELCAQDIMVKLELSQSSASRHLRQLTATGYLLERRREVAKCYSLNPARVEDTLAALRRFFRINGYRS